MKQKKYTVASLPMDDIAQADHQPRTTFEEESIAELAESFKADGLLQPIVVRPNGKGYQVVIGARRLQAAQLAGMKKIPAIIMDITPPEAFELALIENVQREDLTVFEEANAMLHLMRTGKYSNAGDLAKRLGKSRNFVATRLQMLQLPPTIQEMVARRELSINQAQAIGKVADPKQQEAVAKLAAEEALTVEETEALVKKKAVTVHRHLKVGDTLSPLKILERLHHFLSVVESTEWPEIGPETQGKFVELFLILSEDFRQLSKAVTSETSGDTTLTRIRLSEEKVRREFAPLTLLYLAEETERYLRRHQLSEIDKKYRDSVRVTTRRLATTLATYLMKRFRRRRKR